MDESLTYPDGQGVVVILGGLRELNPRPQANDKCPDRANHPSRGITRLTSARAKDLPQRRTTRGSMQLRAGAPQDQLAGRRQDFGTSHDPSSTHRFMNTTTIRPPSTVLLFTEGVRALLDATMTLATWPSPQQCEKGDGHPVLVLPGLGAGDLTTKPLRAFLGRLGYETHGWDQGINCGPRPGVLEKMVTQLSALADGGRKVTVIGWSLGGVYARYLALQHPDLVRQVVTLGSPFAGNVASATNAGVVYRLLSGETVDADDGLLLAIQQTPSVPTTSVFSRTDGVVAWRSSIEQKGPLSENVEVRSSHIGLGLNSSVYRLIADRLAQREGQWRPFAQHSFAYPDPARA